MKIFSRLAALLLLVGYVAADSAIRGAAPEAKDVAVDKTDEVKTEITALEGVSTRCLARLTRRLAFLTSFFFSSDRSW